MIAHSQRISCHIWLTVGTTDHDRRKSLYVRAYTVWDPTHTLTRQKAWRQSRKICGMLVVRAAVAAIVVWLLPVPLVSCGHAWTLLFYYSHNH